MIVKNLVLSIFWVGRFCLYYNLEFLLSKKRPYQKLDKTSFRMTIKEETGNVTKRIKGKKEIKTNKGNKRNKDETK